MGLSGQAVSLVGSLMSGKIKAFQRGPEGFFQGHGRLAAGGWTKREEKF